MRPSITHAILLALFFAVLPANAQSIDWKTIGKPLDDDTKSMMDRYVYINQEATDKNVTLDRPVLSQQDINNWIKEHLTQIMSFDGLKFDAQLTQNRNIFTASGYDNYTGYLNNTGLDKFLKDNRLKTVSFVEGEPQVTAQGLREIPASLEPANPAQANAPKKFNYVWQANAMLVLSYLDYRNEVPPSIAQSPDRAKAQNRFPISVTLELVRIPMQENNNLVAINSIQFAAAQ